VKLLRTISNRRIVVAVCLVLALAGGAAAIVVAAGGSGPNPPAQQLDTAISQALAAPAPEGITGRVTFTNRLFPSGALFGQAGSALMSGASGRLWLTADGRGRVELQSTAGDVQIVWNSKAVTVYDASSNTVYRADLPVPARTTSASDTPPSLARIDSFLTDLGLHAAISAAQPTNIAGQPAYGVSLSPKHDGGLLASAALAWDATRGIPLRVAIYAQGSSTPVLELRATDISYGAVPAGDFDVAPPADAKVVQLAGRPDNGAGGHDTGAPAVTGLAAVQAAAGFHVAAPDTLVGLPRQQVRLIGGHTALAAYGHGLGGILVIERPADPKNAGGQLDTLPTIALDGLTAHELATQLGTVVEWTSGGVTHILAGSVPPAAAEAAAKALR
jgi:outer membrane lipoprotein-sorting protein